MNFHEWNIIFGICYRCPVLFRLGCRKLESTDISQALPRGLLYFVFIFFRIFSMSLNLIHVYLRFQSEYKWDKNLAGTKSWRTDEIDQVWLVTFRLVYCLYRDHSCKTDISFSFLGAKAAYHQLCSLAKHQFAIRNEVLTLQHFFQGRCDDTLLPA